MRRCLYGVLLLLLLLTSGGYPAFGQVRWVTDLKAAQKEAARSKRPLLLDFRATWCAPCQAMERETFTDPTVKALLQRMVCVRIDVDEQPAVAQSYGVQSIPRLVVLPPTGDKPLLDIQGFYPANQLLQELRPVLGLKPDAVIPVANDSSEMQQVLQALQNSRYSALKTANPTLARKGLQQVVERLGVYQEAELTPTATALRAAGDDLIPALLDGMEHKHLAVRAGAYRTLLATLREKNRAVSLAYDPWAAATVRQAQVRRWRQWWKSASSH
jgi:thioredoxin-related protein